jgi:hypothetical protein
LLFGAPPTISEEHNKKDKDDKKDKKKKKDKKDDKDDDDKKSSTLFDLNDYPDMAYLGNNTGANMLV